MASALDTQSEEQRDTQVVTERLIRWWNRSRLRGWLLVAAVSALAAYLARDVRPDYSVEHFFPTDSRVRTSYEAFQRAFPHEDAQAIVIIEAGDLFSREGVARIAQLEDALADLPHVISVEGPASILDIRGEFGVVEATPLFPDDMDDAALDEARRIATQDPLFARRLAKPDGSAMFIRVSLDPESAKTDQGRSEFYDAARELLERPEQREHRLSLTGQPAIRARFSKMVARDVSVLLPLAFVVALIVLFASYRNFGVVAAGAVTIAASMLWSFAVLGAAGYSITALSSILPMVVMIISISDSIHIINHYLEERRAGRDHRRAADGALLDSAGPCLATEVVLACGFASLAVIGIEGIVQFGLSAAASMLLTWLANVTVLPLVLGFVRSVPAAPRSERAPVVTRLLVALIGKIESLVVRRQLPVVVVATVVLAGAAYLARGAHAHSYVFDDLPEDSAFYKDLRHAEGAIGGLVSVAIHARATDADAGEKNVLLEPAVLSILDEAAETLRGYSEVGQAISPATFLRKANRVFTGENKLPDSRELAAQELVFIDDGELLREVLSHNRRDAAAMGYATDMGSSRGAVVLDEIDDWIATKQHALDSAGLPVELRLTGQLAVQREVTDSLVGGLIGSFGSTVLLTIVIFCLVLRSWQLGLIGMIPNVAPMVLTGAFMALMDISLRPSTVVVFAIILVVADDDTLQYLTRLRGHFRIAVEQGNRRPHREASLRCLRETGTAMVMTSSAVSAGFLVLLVSDFQGIVDLGMLIGFTLFAALFADLFLSPILVMRIRPRLGALPAGAQDSRLATPAPGPATSDPSTLEISGESEPTPRGLIGPGSAISRARGNGS